MGWRGVLNPASVPLCRGATMAWSLATPVARPSVVPRAVAAAKIGASAAIRCLRRRPEER